MKTIRLFLSACLLIAPVALWSQSKGDMPLSSTSPEASKLVRQAWSAFMDAKMDDGNKLVNQAIENDPDFAMAYISLNTNDSELRNQNFKKAEGLKLSPDEKLFIDGIKAGQENKPTAEYFDPLVKKYPKDDILHTLIMFNTRDVNVRAAIGEAVVKRSPKFAPAYNMLGYTYMEKNEMAKAEASFDKYITLRPDLGNVYDSKGDYMMRNNNFKEAAALFEKAATMGMTTSTVKAQRASARMKFPKPSEKDIEVLKGIITASSEEFVKGNVDAFFKYYADQSIELYGNQMTNVGLPNLRQRAVAMFKNGSFTKLNCTLESVDGAGSIAMAWGKSEAVFKTTATGAMNESKDNVIFLFRKQGDGNWKILADHFFEGTQEESADDVAKVRKVLASWNASLKSGEVTTEKHHNALAALYSGQAVEIFPSQRSNVGIANIQARWVPLMGAKFETNSLGPIGVEVIGRRAVAWGVAVQNLYPKGSEVLAKNQFPWSMILTKEKDDAWKILLINWASE